MLRNNNQRKASRSPKRKASRSRSARNSRSRSRSRVQQRARSPSPVPASSHPQQRPDEDVAKDKAEAAASTLLSFRDFTLQKLDANVTPDEAVAKYAEFKQALLQESLQLLKGSGLLFDFYNPLALHRQKTLRATLAQSSAQCFLTDMTQNRYANVHLVSTSGSSAPINALKACMCQTPGHLKAPHFAFDPDVNALVLSSMPLTTSMWKVQPPSACS